MCHVASSDDSETDASTLSELPMACMSSLGESPTDNPNAPLITLQLQVDIAGPSEPPQIAQSRKVVIVEPNTSEGKCRIKVSEKAR